MDEAAVFEAFVYALQSEDGLYETIYWKFYRLFSGPQQQKLDRYVDATNGWYYWSED